MSDQHRNRVEQRAYELWEREGRPEGRRDHHWAEAERQIAAEQAHSATGDASAALAAHSADAPQSAASSGDVSAQAKAKPPAAATARPGRKTAGGR